MCSRPFPLPGGVEELVMIKMLIFALIPNTRTNANGGSAQAGQTAFWVPDDVGCNHTEEALCP